MRCPRKMFSATERSGASVVSCVTVAMPWRSASVGARNEVGRPANWMDPASGWIWPERIRSNVDLPEPFSPISACTSARLTRSVAPRSACTPPYRLCMPSASRIGGASCMSGVTTVLRGGLRASPRRPAQPDREMGSRRSESRSAELRQSRPGRRRREGRQRCTCG